jgi:hypothetical protein
VRVRAACAAGAPDDPDVGLDDRRKLVGVLLAQVNLVLGAVEAERHGFLGLGAVDIDGQDDLRTLRHHRLELPREGSRQVRAREATARPGNGVACHAITHRPAGRCPRRRQPPGPVEKQAGCGIGLLNGDYSGRTLGVPRPKPSARQLDILRWIADGCPHRAWPDESHKLSARALQSRGLARVTRKGKRWHAVLSEDGRHYLDHGTYPDRPAAERETVLL